MVTDVSSGLPLVGVYLTPVSVNVNASGLYINYAGDCGNLYGNPVTCLVLPMLCGCCIHHVTYETLLHFTAFLYALCILW